MAKGGVRGDRGAQRGRGVRQLEVEGEVGSSVAAGEVGVGRVY